MKIFGCHGNELPIKEMLYQSVFGDKYYMIGHKFTISVTMDVSPFARCLARAVLNTTIRNVHYAARFAMHVSHKIGFQLARRRYHSLARTTLLEYLHLQHPNICEYRWADMFECYMVGTTILHVPGQ